MAGKPWHWAVPLRALGLVSCGLLAMLAIGPAARAIDTPKTPETQRVGYSIRITLPIDGQTSKHVQQFVRRAVERARSIGARPVLILEFDVPPGQGQLGRGSEFGAVYSLADFLSSEEMNGVTTVAYLPEPIQGHAVLAALACDQILMAPDASLGQAGADEKIINPPTLSAYREIAGRRRTVPVAIAIGMLNPAVEVLEVKTETGTEYVTPDAMQELKNRRTIEKPTTLKTAGEAWELSAAEGRRLGFVAYIASNRREVAKALDLPPVAVQDDPSLADGWRAIRVNLNGPIFAKNVNQIQKMIEDQIRQRDVNFVCLCIESAGGKTEDILRLADFLAMQLDPSKVRTVAYIPKEARSNAALVALACDQVIMHPQAVLGGPGAYEPTADEIDQARHFLSKQLAPRKGRSWSLMAAMIDPNLAVFSARKPGDIEYFCTEELESQPDAAKWQKGQVITTPGVPLKLTGAQAKDYGLVNRIVDDFQQCKQFFGLEDDPALLEPGWAHFAVDWLASPFMALVLLLIGGIGVYVEFHTPGTGVGAFVAFLCFLLFFWSRFDGTAGWLEVSLFLAGVVCLLLEIFVIPGFGIFGLGGGLLILVSVVLASQTFVWPHNEWQVRQFQQSLLTVVGAGGGMMVAAFLLRHWLPRAPVLGHMLLTPPTAEEAETIRRREALVDLHDLMGQQGVTTTRLNPAGKARFGDRLVDVMADGESVDRNVPIEVIDVRGSRVLVREIK